MHFNIIKVIYVKFTANVVNNVEGKGFFCKIMNMISMPTF